MKETINKLGNEIHAPGGADQEQTRISKNANQTLERRREMEKDESVWVPAY